MPTLTLEKNWLRLDEAAPLAGVAPRTLRRWVRNGLVRASRPGGKLLLVDRGDLERFLAENASGGRVACGQ